MLDKHPLKSKTTIFLHMPKTGGTTLNHLIHRNYMPERTFTVPNAVMETYGDKKHFQFATRPSSLELWLFQLSVKSRESIIVSKLNSTATHTRNALKTIKSVFN
jgi:hypothetical protein